MKPTEVDEVLWDDDEEFDPDTPAEVPLDPERADWHLRKGLALKAEMRGEQALFEDAIARLQERAGERKRIAQKKVDWHCSAVEAWHRRELAAKRAKPVVHLPSGVSKVTASGVPEIVVVDEDKFRAALAEMTTEDGETWENAVYQRQPRKYSVSELRRLSWIAAEDKKAEPGAAIALRGQDSEPLPGLRVTRKPSTWKGGE